VRRPMATPDRAEGSMASLGAFRDACRKTARAARSPYAGRRSDPTGGAGQDGVVRPRGGYR